MGDAQARKLLDAPPDDTLKGDRDRAILATLLYHGIRREELCRLRINGFIATGVAIGASSSNLAAGYVGLVSDALVLALQVGINL